jgi:hypothetical protein
MGGLFGAFNDAQAAEQRCNELGANCVCSEPLNTQSFTVVGGWGYDPADTTAAECSEEGVQGVFFSNGSNVYQTVNSGEAITNLPPGHTNTWVTRVADGASGGFGGTQFPANAPTARRHAGRFAFTSTIPPTIPSSARTAVDVPTATSTLSWEPTARPGAVRFLRSLEETGHSTAFIPSSTGIKMSIVAAALGLAKARWVPAPRR